jgi:hypothetical protein
MNDYRPAEWKGVPKHQKAMGAHRILAFVYAGLALFVLAIAIFSGSLVGLPATLALFIPAAVHGVIALGAARANPVAQVFSVLTGVFLLLGFPIGTVIGIYLLRNASWDRPSRTGRLDTSA